MPNCLNLSKVHLWLPNIFEFKGGIQVYLKNLIQVLEFDKYTQKIKVFDKLDRAKPSNLFNSEKFSFLFSGNIPRLLQTPHFALNLAIGSWLNRPSLILCGHLNFAPLAYWINRLTGIPYWLIIYGVEALDIDDKWKIKALHAAAEIISISVYTRERLIEEQNLPLDKITILPVTFDAKKFKIAPKPNYLLRRYNLKNEQPVILTVSRLSTADGYKGYDTILQALPAIQSQLPNVHYIIVGKGDDRPRIEKLIAQLNLQDCVTLSGFIPDEEICDHYNLCDVFAMPSKGEGFGIVYLEALACGKPTLGGNQDGAIDALNHGELGALVDPDDVNAIANTLIQILQGNYPNPLMYQPEALRQKVIELFGFERFQKTLGAYLEQHFLSTQSQGTDY
ncbi:MAG: glycosyltransferase family 4 protein [Moorea sp. SIO4A3]|nr:glycosyltransferase family 4 protein [Moorena sp. SIO4A3]